MAKTRATPSKEAAAAIAVAGAAAVGGKLAWDMPSGDGGDDPRAYRLHEREFVPDGIRRIARGRLDYAIERLDSDTNGDELAANVHETRKSLKRLRGCLRLARPAIGDEIYTRENTAFREAGRRLSGARDARVLLEALDDLSGRFGSELSPAVTDRLRTELAKDDERAEAALRGRASPVTRALDELRGARERTVEWTFEADGFDALAPGLRRIYRRGRRRMRAVERHPGDEQLHEWRKRVKDLWYASQIVTPAAPKRMRRFAKSAHHLSDLLGDDHDLAVLKSYVDDHPYYFTHDSQRLALRAAIGRRREQLQREALALGPKLYQQSPEKFVRSVERSWRKRAGKQDEPVAA